ncbi:helix-turn-helix domain-containing protein [Candidatus Phycosocius spiralis]|uniref:Transcriptional regulator n=1 Tax=Candidatus Phycosocius spiralis TaxID=2815099 RepID=A0ABQ4PX81_9PROT|nr:helix-turn-helix domain-containing protein [Candidatus Phycosocius spiralis]GIU67695.1 transcriptional regulator [Candidatus Phycosocius spiralis]
MFGEQSESVRPIRALLRGLEALSALNGQDGMTVTEVAERALLPRTTAYRILETLCQGGFVVRDEMDDRYRPTLAVTTLAEGAQNEAWIREGAWPLISQLGKQILWPIGIWTLRGNDITLRAATDRTSPMALHRQTSGAHADLLESGVGQILQAFEATPRRNLLEEIGLQRLGDRTINHQLDLVRQQGYAFDLKVAGGEIALAVPVMQPVASEGSSVLAALTVRFIRSALTDERAISELLPKLLRLSEAISEAYLKYAPPTVKSIRLSSRAKTGANSDDWAPALA